MPKLTLPALTRHDFQTEMPVCIQHVNYGKHLGHDALVSLLHEARVRFLHSLGHTELKIGDAGLILRDLAVQYLAEAFHGDLLRFQLAVTEWHPHGFELTYQVSHAASRQPVARARTTMVCFDYTSRKPLRLPADFQALFPPLETA
ncbi:MULTISPECIES: acyl-CoA thioesterase [Leeia]|uniref:Acyl-CoA thioesterase n=1 Tax=Leeia aquatica TaxID=2725557 RepID=A0A847SIR5_9NEIS|nr:thioesterase family protein [Leeia aquatica]NLR75782.1 acyl-CoA thioesterase [Leeia aquatica]